MDDNTPIRARLHHARRSGDAIVVQVVDGPTRVLPPGLAGLLQRLDRARPVRAWLDRISASEEQLRRALRRLRTLGLIETPDDLRQRWPARGEDPVGVHAITIPTRDRPEALQRAVSSVTGSGPPLWIIDSSGRPRPPSSHRRVDHRDNAALDALAAELGERTGHVEAARLALGRTRDGWRAGAARNAALLLGAGRGLVSLDDDLLSEAHRLGPCDLGDFGTHADPDPSFFQVAPSVEAALAQHPTAPVDLAQVFTRVLGQPAEVLLDPTGHAERPRLGHRLSRGARAVAVRAGVVGDTGLGSPLLWLTSRGETLQGLAGTPESWERHRRSRAGLRVVRRACLTDTPGFMTPAWGVDLRALVPPFMPWGRASDAVWGAMLHVIRPDAIIAHLPLAFAHRPHEPRPWDLALAARGVAHLRYRDIVVDAVLSARPLAERPAERLEHLARRLQALARLAPPDRIRHLRGARLRILAGRLRSVGAPVPDGLAPGYLATRSLALRALQESLLDDAIPLQDCADPAELSRRLGELATVMLAWPDLVSAATEAVG